MTDLSLSARTRRVPLGAALRAAGAAVLALAFTVALAACLSALTGCSSDEASSAQTGGEKATEGAPTAEAGVLMVASALNSEPYEQATSTSQIGFTVELLRLVGERAGLDVQFAKAVNHKDADQNITPGRPKDVAAKVAAGEADLGASSIPADAALEGVALSEPYLHADYAVVTKMDTGHDDLASIQDAGTVVAVQNDAAIAAWVAENLPEAEVVAFEDGIDALMELNSERAQAAIVDEPRFRRYVQVKEPHLQAVELVASDKDYAFAVAAGNEALLTAVNEALTALRADGSYDALYDSWFGDAGIANEAAASREKGTGNAPEAVQDSTGA